MPLCNKGGDWNGRVGRKCKQPCTEGSMYCEQHKHEALERVRAIAKKLVVPEHAA